MHMIWQNEIGGMALKYLVSDIHWLERKWYLKNSYEYEKKFKNQKVPVLVW
jgi:hypothetical protein